MCVSSAPLPCWSLIPKFLVPNTPCGVTVTLCVGTKGAQTLTQSDNPRMQHPHNPPNKEYP